MFNLVKNAGVALPNATVAGYIPPNTMDDPDQKFIKHKKGHGTGEIGLDVVDPYAILDNHTYNVVFNTLDSMRILFLVFAVSMKF